MSRTPRHQAPGEGGFVIVGVVMFVLALTILGLSLFGLSGFEAEFTTQSMQSEQAFFSACSGVEHAKFVLAKRESLGAVGDASLFPDPNIVYARARVLSGPGTDTLGSIDALPLGTPIEIRVLAQVGQERRMIQGDYVATQSQNLFKRLMCIVEFVHLKQLWSLLPPPPELLFATMDVPFGSSAGVWQGHPSTTWVVPGLIDLGLVHPLQPIPPPDLAPYYARFWNLAADISGVPIGGGVRRFDLQSGGTIPGGPADIQFFRTEQDPNNDAVDPADNLKYSVIAGTSTIEIDMAGDGAKTAIWLLDHGAFFGQGVDFHSDPGDALVIVSWTSGALGPAPHNAPVGIHFFAGLNSRDLPVILVTPAQVVLEQNGTGQYADIRANYLTLYARSAWLAGCRRDATHLNTTMWLHPAGHVLDLANGLIDRLWELGALPNSDTGTRFKSVAGTWVELDPDNPPLFD